MGNLGAYLDFLVHSSDTESIQELLLIGKKITKYDCDLKQTQKGNSKKYIQTLRSIKRKLNKVNDILLLCCRMLSINITINQYGL
jgi:hypothetical protein